MSHAPRTRRHWIPALLLGLAVWSAGGATASAQYFGRNKVQYKDFDFQILRTEHFDIYFYPSAREGIDISARLVERWHARLERLLEHTLRGRQPLVLYASHPDFEQTNAIQGELGEGTGGVTEPLRRRIIQPLAGPLADTDHVLGHELVHAFQFDITTRPGSAPGETGAGRLPLWFIEGMAEYLSLGPVDPNTAMWLRDAVRQSADTEDEDAKNALPTIERLDNPRYFPYRWGQAFWAYVTGRWGDRVLGEMLRTAGATGDTELAIQRVLGVTGKELSEDWHAAIRRAYEPVLARSAPPSEVGHLLIKGENLGGDLNVGPALSPDGRWIAFLSERSLFSIDLYLADAKTGEIAHKLTSTATDPHTSSLQFIYSAGAWDSASQRIAIATITGGRPALAIFNAASGDRERELRIPELDEIFNPTWSPDGRSICFTGMSRGLTDLYLYDLETSTMRQLTNDPFADLQPAWSPDGRRIAFATDRFSSQLETLDFGPYRLALIDPATGRIEQVPAFTNGKNMNPQWAPDSRALFFVSDRDGIPNLYHVSLERADVSQITNVSTGLSGITATSPVLSVASRAGIAAMTVYDRGTYHIYTLSPENLTSAIARGREMREASTDAATLPPQNRQSTDVAQLLADSSFGLPAKQEYEVDEYKAGLGLEAVGQPTIAIGADRFGAAIGGGLAFYFSDMLGDQNLVTAIQFNAGVSGNYSFKNTAAQAQYINMSNRWNWGIVGGQVPYISGGIRQGFGDIEGVPAFIEETIMFRQTDRSVAGLVAYPFNRAQRLEFQAGVSQISFDQVVQTQAFDPRTGQLFFEDSETTSLGESLALGTSSAALVFDTSNFGATSPVQGQRYRFEVAPTFGTIRYTSVLADFRRYFMPAPFYTFAGRIMHYGRYGTGGQDERLFPLFIGYPNLIRGYDVNSFSASECVGGAPGACPAFDNLIGSRLLVGNLEFRFPLLRPFGASQGMYGPLPVEVAFFADGGVAWEPGDRPSFFGGERKPIASTGVTFRVNLMGFAIGQFDFVRPLDRPAKGWMFQFNLSPGF
jgi:WD40 repeat protein